MADTKFAIVDKDQAAALASFFNNPDDTIGVAVSNLRKTAEVAETLNLTVQMGSQVANFSRQIADILEGAAEPMTAVGANIAGQLSSLEQFEAAAAQGALFN